MGATNMLPGTVSADGQTVAVGGTTLRVSGTPGMRVLLSIRPETLRPIEPAGTPNTIEVRLTLREFLGPVQRLHATLPDGTPIRIAALGGEDLRIPPDGVLTLAYDAAQITLYPVP
jgi:hypothetical protein